MEDTLQLILSKLGSLETGQAEMRADITDIRSELTNIRSEQAEMRKEVAFYYGSMMKKLDETKNELSSELKQFSYI